MYVTTPTQTVNLWHPLPFAIRPSRRGHRFVFTQLKHSKHGRPSVHSIAPPQFLAIVVLGSLVGAIFLREVLPWATLLVGACVVLSLAFGMFFASRRAFRGPEREVAFDFRRGQVRYRRWSERGLEYEAITPIAAAAIQPCLVRQETLSCFGVLLCLDARSPERSIRMLVAALETPGACDAYLALLPSAIRGLPRLPMAEIEDPLALRGKLPSDRPLADLVRCPSCGYELRPTGIWECPECGFGKPRKHNSNEPSGHSRDA